MAEPTQKDLKHPDVGKYLDKYLKGVASVPTKDRVRMTRLIENMVLGVGYLVDIDLFTLRPFISVSEDVRQPSQ